MWLKIVLFSIFGFTNSLTTSFDLRGVIHGNRMAGVPLGSSLGAGEVDVEGVCGQAGMACQNCSQAITCIALPVGWLKVPLEACAKGQTCNAHLGGCSTTPVPECEGSMEYRHSCEQCPSNLNTVMLAHYCLEEEYLALRCYPPRRALAEVSYHQVGIFPDSHDCRKFHLCSPQQGLPDGRPANHGIALCPRNYGYNPQTAQCSVKLPHGQCKNTPVPTCGKVGDSGAVRSSLNHYYVCLMKQGSLQPQIFICPHGWYFWGGFCRPEPEPSNSLESNSSEESSGKTAKPTEKATEKTVYRVDSFFSTEKATTYTPDTFLADKYDLTNYETVDDNVQNREDYFNSFESFN